MPTRTHRETTLARRTALLEAAIELVAELGVSGVTHRAVAKRAGLPPSTTSYFFPSVDDLVLAALREFVAAQIAQLEQLTAAVDLDKLVDVLLSEPSHFTVAQFEGYLEATRRPDLRAEVVAVLDAYEGLAREALTAAGADPEGARAFLALIDGFALQRLVRGEDAGLREGMRALLAAYGGDAAANDGGKR